MSTKNFRQFFLDYIKTSADAVLAADSNMKVISISAAARHILPGLDAGSDISSIVDPEGIAGGLVEFYEYDAEVTALPSDGGDMYIFRFPKSTYAVTYAFPPYETRYADIIESLVSSLYNPLTVIFSAAELLSKSKEARVTKKETDALRQSGYRLLKLAHNMGAFAAAGQERESKNKHVVNINAAKFIKSVTDTVADALRKKGIGLEVSADARVFIKADEERFERIILLLTANAVKRSKRGDTVRISLFETPSAVAVSIWDTGAAQSPAEMEHTFAGGGMLSYDSFDAAAAKLYIEQLSGTMVSASDSHGSRITFTLPKGSAADALFEPKREKTPKGRFEQYIIDLSDVADYRDLRKE